MLNAIYDRLPDLYPYCTSAYFQPSVLFYSSFILMSDGEHNRATLLVRFFSVTLFNRYCFHFKRSWFLDSLTIFFRWVVITTRWPEMFSRLSRLASEWGLDLMSTSVNDCRPRYYHHGPIIAVFRAHCNPRRYLTWCTVILGSKS